MPPTFTVVRITPTIDIGTPNANTGVDRLKPVETPATPRPASTSSARVTPKPEPTMGGPKPTPKPGDAPTIKPIPNLQVSPTPSAVRKGQPNANVDPQKYAMELLADLQILGEEMEKLSDLMTAWEDDEATEAEVIVGIQRGAKAMNEIYIREVQRDFPPQLKEIDDYYVETLRAGDRMFQLIVKLLQTGDTTLLPQIEKASKDFQYFGSEFIKRVQKQ